MKYRTSLYVLCAMALALLSATSIAGGAAQQHGADRMHQIDRDRPFDRNRVLDRDRAAMRARPRDWDRLNLRDPREMEDREIYGHEFMTAEECNQYRDRLRSLGTPDQRQKFQAKHEAVMQNRALKKGGDLVPPGQGPIFGGELMTVQERNRYREQLRRLDEGEERRKFLAAHRDRMNKRARALGYKIKEVE